MHDLPGVGKNLMFHPVATVTGLFEQAIDGHILSGGVIRGEFVASKQMN